jgi:UDP-N-acetyl-D-glucosamine dehydrogenase
MELTPEVIRQQDAVLIVTDHTDVDYDSILENARLIVDTRGIYRNSDAKVVRA